MSSKFRFFLRQARKLSLYFAVPALSAVAPLIVIPSVTSEYGADGWASIAVAMSLGGGAAILAELGWAVIGPQRVARDPANALAIYRLSLGTKLSAIAVLAPLAALTALFLVPVHRFGASLIAFALVVAVVSPAWFFIGKGRPLMVLATETVPKVSVACLSAILIARGAPLELYGVGLLLSTCIGFCAAAHFGGLPLWPDREAFAGTRRTVRAQRMVILGRGVSALYTALPTALLGTVNSGSVAAFSAADRPMRMGTALLSGVPNRLQSWVGTPDLDEVRRRSMVSIWINTTLGLIAFTGYVLLAPPTIDALFSGQIDVSMTLVFLSGALACLICVSRGVGLALVAADRANSITSAIIISAVVGTTGLFTFGYLFGAAGALAALLAAEGTGIVVQLAIYRRAWRNDG